MYEVFIKIRNTIIFLFYKYILKPIFFKIDPEKVHDHMTNVGKIFSKHPVIRKLFSLTFNYKNSILSQNILGLNFINPIGLSAGFDKNAELTELLPHIGFGFVEVGSITGEPCDGNPKPRLWRLALSKSLVVYYGLKNDGAEIISKRLKNKKNSIPVGVSIAMTNCQKNLDINNAIQDYKKAFELMEETADYITINISCPNTLTDQPFIQSQNLENLLTELDKVASIKPIFIKLSPDIKNEEIDILLNTFKKHRVDGIICSNLTKNRHNNKIIEKDIPQKGGLSGKVVENLSDELLSYIYKKEGKRFVLVGVGGIFTAEDIYRKIKNGASLVQLITGMIYEGPQLISTLNQDLAKLLQNDGYENISSAIGVDVLK
jgi:dihydroorotate dehydrogenase